MLSFYMMNQKRTLAFLKALQWKYGSRTPNVAFHGRNNEQKILKTGYSVQKNPVGLVVLKSA